MVVCACVCSRACGCAFNEARTLCLERLQMSVGRAMLVVVITDQSTPFHGYASLSSSTFLCQQPSPYHTTPRNRTVPLHTACHAYDLHKRQRRNLTVVTSKTNRSSLFATCVARGTKGHAHDTPQPPRKAVKIHPWLGFKRLKPFLSLTSATADLSLAAVASLASSRFCSSALRSLLCGRRRECGVGVGGTTKGGATSTGSEPIRTVKPATTRWKGYACTCVCTQATATKHNTKRTHQNPSKIRQGGC